MSTKIKLAAMTATVSTLLASSAAFAQAGGAAERSEPWGPAVGAAVAIGLAALGGTLGQGRATASALEGISRNPGPADRIQPPMILGLALIESLVLFSFIIPFLLQGKLP